MGLLRLRAASSWGYSHASKASSASLLGSVCHLAVAVVVGRAPAARAAANPLVINKATRVRVGQNVEAFGKRSPLVGAAMGMSPTDGDPA